MSKSEKFDPNLLANFISLMRKWCIMAIASEGKSLVLSFILATSIRSRINHVSVRTNTSLQFQYLIKSDNCKYVHTEASASRSFNDFR